MKMLTIAAVVGLALSCAQAEAASGVASWYKMGYRTANGEHFNPDGHTCAHRYLPFGTRLLVRNKRTGRSVVVRVNDRGPFVRGRVLDLSRGAARAIGMTGTQMVSYDVVGGHHRSRYASAEYDYE
jgi:rare lipoprotein A